MKINKILFKTYQPPKFEQSEKQGISISDCATFPCLKPNSYPKNYYIPFKGDNFKQELEKTLQNCSEDEIFTFLYNELKKRSDELRISLQFREDVVQDAILNIFLLMENKNMPVDELMSKINDIYLLLKPNKNNFVKHYGEVSLEKAIMDGDKALSDIIPDDENHRINYLRKPDEKQKQKARKELNFAFADAELSERQNLC